MAEKKPVDVGDETSVTEQQTAADLVRQREVVEFKALLGTYGGRSLIWRVLDKSGVHSSSFVAGYCDVTSFNEGGRSLGLWLLDEVFTSDENAYTLMRSEAIIRETEGN